MSGMKLLDTVQTFFRKNPAYEASLVELSAAVYVLACKMVGFKPTVIIKQDLKRND